MLLGDGGITGELSPECPLNRNNWSVLHKLQHTKRLLLRSHHYGFVTSQTEKKGEWDCACAQNLNTCCFVPCGKLTSACVLIAVMADWNCSNHFDTHCIIPFSPSPRKCGISPRNIKLNFQGSISLPEVSVLWPTNNKLQYDIQRTVHCDIFL